MFSTPYHHSKGSGFKKGVCRSGFYASRSLHLGALHGIGCCQRGPWAPFMSMPSPPCHLTVSFPWKSLQADNCGWNVLGCYSGSSISTSAWASFTTLPKWTTNSSVTPSILLGLSLSWSSSLPVHPLLLNVPNVQQAFFRRGLVALEFPQGEETSSPWFGRIIGSLSSGASGQLYRVFLLGLAGGP